MEYASSTDRDFGDQPPGIQGRASVTTRQKQSLLGVRLQIDVGDLFSCQILRAGWGVFMTCGDKSFHAMFLLFSAALVCQQANHSTAQEAAVAIPETAESPARNQQELDADIASFDRVWKTIRDRNWDDNFDLEAWESTRDRLRPEVEQSKSIRDTRSVLNKLISSLEKSHYGIIPSEIYDKIKSAKEEKKERESQDGTEADDSELEGEAGLSIRVVDGVALVTKVESGSGADEAGIKTGWVVLRHKDKDVSGLYDELKAEIPETSPIRPDTLAAMAIEGKLVGEVGETIDLTFLDESDTDRKVTMTYKARTGNVIQFGHLPEMQVKSESRTIDASIGYVWFSLFFDPVAVMKDLKAAVKAAEAGKGLILDMRGNHGGLAGMTMGVGNHFVRDKKLYLGTLTTKENDLRFVLIPRARPYDGPVAMLVDECSISSAEILAGGLQAIGRARVFGVQTAGAALPSTVEMLPNGDRFQFAIAGYTDSNGRNIEGNGVTPDEIVSPSRDALLKGGDPILDAAVAWIKEQEKNE